MKRLLFFLALSGAVLFAEPKYALSICSLFRDEARFLNEWIEYHRMLGVDHFYLYNNLSEDAYEEVLYPYIEAGIVDLYDWPYFPEDSSDWVKEVQCKAFNKTLKEHGEESKWIAFVDTDEFIALKQGSSLPRFLKGYESYGALVINWKTYGTSGIEIIPEDQSMIEALQLCAPLNHPVNLHLKSIVRPLCVSHFVRSPHAPKYKEHYYPVDEHRRKTTGGKSRKVSHDRIWLSHYIYRDEEFYYSVKAKRRKLYPGKEPAPPNPTFSDAKDKSMLRFVPTLHTRLGR